MLTGASLGRTDRTLFDSREALLIVPAVAGNSGDIDGFERLLVVRGRGRGLPRSAFPIGAERRGGACTIPHQTPGGSTEQLCLVFILVGSSVVNIGMQSGSWSRPAQTSKLVGRPFPTTVLLCVPASDSLQTLLRVRPALVSTRPSLADAAALQGSSGVLPG